MTDVQPTVEEQIVALINTQKQRVAKISQTRAPIDWASKDRIIIGICPGDGIGPVICAHAQRVLAYSLNTDIQSGRIEIRQIDGLTIENRAKHDAAIPSDVLNQLKCCDVILKGPTTTPQKGSPWPNLESANVAMRRELDLYACIRPISVPELGIDWVFFRENTEGAYALGSKGMMIDDAIGLDVTITTNIGTQRIAKMAFDYAKINHKKRVSIITKSNVIKTTDGQFSSIAFDVAKSYEQYGIQCDEWYVDIMAAKMIDPDRQSQFQVIVCPNLYGDILTDLAGQIQGGVGTAGSANIGDRYAMFEAIHGSAPRMVAEGRSAYANPSSMIKASSMLLNHIGYMDASNQLNHALQTVNQSSKKTATCITDDILHYLRHDK